MPFNDAPPEKFDGLKVSVDAGGRKAGFPELIDDVRFCPAEAGTPRRAPFHVISREDRNVMPQRLAIEGRLLGRNADRERKNYCDDPSCLQRSSIPFRESDRFQASGRVLVEQT